MFIILLSRLSSLKLLVHLHEVSSLYTCNEKKFLTQVEVQWFEQYTVHKVIFHPYYQILLELFICILLEYKEIGSLAERP
jgi:hypothetical protein